MYIVVKMWIQGHVGSLMVGTFLIMLHTILLHTILPCGCEELRLLGQMSMSGPVFPYGDACMPPVHMALDDINAHPDMLPGYNLTFHHVDSMCNAGKAVFRILDALKTTPRYHMIVGGGCSTSIAATSEVTHLWNLTHFSSGGSAKYLGDRRRFPRLYRLASSDFKFNSARVGMLKLFGWRNVATIHHGLEFFSSATEDFIKAVNEAGIKIITNEIFLHDPQKHVQNLKNHDARIIFVAMYEDSARQVLCEAYKIGFYGQKIVWIFHGWYSTRFWEYKLDSISCTADEMLLVADGAFLIVSVFRNPIEERGIANMTAKEFDVRFENHNLYKKATKPFDFLAAECYDNIWLAALALNCTMQRLAREGHRKTLADFDYSDGDINQMIFECLGHTPLIGVSGRVSLIHGDPDYDIEIDRVQDGRRVRIAYYMKDKKPHYFNWLDGALVWKDGKIPRDSTYVEYEEAVIPTSMYATICASAIVGMVTTAAFFVFSLVNRSKSVIKDSSPVMNSILLLGCDMCYISTLFKTTGATNPAVCAARKFTLCLGFTMAYGSLFCRIWRVYRIFTNKRLHVLRIKDRQLLCMMAVIVVVMTVVMVTQAIVDPHTVFVKNLEDEIYNVGNDMQVRPFIRVCNSYYSYEFGWAMYILLGGWLCLGAFLAFETRHEHKRGQTDANLIGMCIYNVLIMSSAGLTMAVMLANSDVTVYCVTSGCVVIATTLTQCTVYIPKVYVVYRPDEPEADVSSSLNGRPKNRPPSGPTSPPSTEAPGVNIKVRMLNK